MNIYIYIGWDEGGGGGGGGVAPGLALAAAIQTWTEPAKQKQ